jgi:geranylgeranyl pyrophosphate synthase
MSLSFLSECKEKVFQRIDTLLPDTNKVISAMRYSALADSKCIRAGLIFASGNLNKEISELALIDMATSIELMHTLLSHS